MTIQGQIARYRATCNNLLRLFCEKHGFDPQDVRWAADTPGTFAVCGDYSFDIGDIIDDLESDAPPEAIFEWYEEYLATDRGIRFCAWWKDKQNMSG